MHLLRNNCLWLAVLTCAAIAAEPRHESPTPGRDLSDIKIYALTPVPRNAADNTVFGVPFVSTDSSKLVVASELRVAAALPQPRPAPKAPANPGKGRGATSAQPKNEEPIPAAPQSRRLDYSKALAFVPFDMVTSYAVVIDRAVFRVNDGFEVHLPLSTFIDDNSIRESEKGIAITGVFYVRNIEHGVVTLDVRPMANYPAQNLVLKYKLKN